MHETLKKMCMMKDKLLAMLESGQYQLDSNDGGQIVDMIKDLADAEKNCWKACYYKTIVKAMQEGEFKEDDEEIEEMEEIYGRMGYNNRRYSSGRYAPAGRGHVSGFWPEVHNPRTYPHLNEMMEKMGYPERDGKDDEHNMSRYGYSYDRFDEARKNYSTTKDPHLKNEMDMHANEHLKGTLETMRDIWNTADPDLRKKMKHDLTSLVNEMN